MRRRQSGRLQGQVALCVALARLGTPAQVVLSFLALGFAPASAWAQSDACTSGTTRDYETFPGAMASRVALDAPVRVRLRQPRQAPLSATQVQAALSLRALVDGVVGSTLPGAASWLGADTLWFQPDALLAPQTRYEVTVSADLLGEETRFAFTTGQYVDSGPPLLRLDGDTVIIETAEAPESCDAPPGSYLVNMALVTNPTSAYPVDDADDGAVEYFAFLSRAHGLSAPRFLARTRRPGQAYEPTIRFVLLEQELQSPVCVVIQAFDGVMNKAETEPEICFDPVTDAHFEPMCAVAAPGGPRGRRPLGALGVLLGFLVALRVTVRRCCRAELR